MLIYIYIDALTNSLPLTVQASMKGGRGMLRAKDSNRVEQHLCVGVGSIQQQNLYGSNARCFFAICVRHNVPIGHYSS